MSQAIQWECLRFAQLRLQSLYVILRLRQEVFVVEQECAFLDADGHDLNAWHVCAWQSGQLIAYARVFAAGEIRREASIGRVLTALTRRGEALGQQLMRFTIWKMQNMFPEGPVWIGAQERLCRFYASFGFVESGERYLEDGIWHRGMQAQLSDLSAK